MNLDWITNARCQDADPEMFHPVMGEDPGKRSKAKAFCRRCPVREECLDYALTVPNLDKNGRAVGWVDGIWGGTLKSERKRMRLMRGITYEGLTEEN